VKGQIQMTSLSATATEVEIKGALYAVEAIPAGEFGQSAVRVTKLVNGESYDVIRTRLDLVECSCPDWVVRHDGKGTMCKHGRAMVVAGYLAAPCPIPNKPAVRPITAKDIAAARTWGLKLPAAPILLEILPTPAPAPVVVEAAPVVEPAPAVVEPAKNPRDDWDASSDEFTWELGPEPVEVEASIATVDPEGRTIGATLEANGDLVVTWSAPAPAPAPVEAVSETRASYLPGFAPTLEQDAERLGYQLGVEGEPARAPKGWDFPRLVAFYGGFLAGQAALEAEILADLDWIEERNAYAFSEPMDRLDPSELAEFGGRPTFEN
jgi:hypothetical protein